MLIQMPILFALYPVIRDIPTYVKGVKDVYMPVTEAIMNTNGFQKIMETIGEASPVLMNPKAYDYSQADTIVNVLYKFQDSTWNALMEKMPSITDLAQQTMDKVTHLNSFLGINIGEATADTADNCIPQRIRCRDHPCSTYSGTCRSDTVYQC